MRYKRLCNICEELYRPKDKYGKCCDRCKKEAIEISAASKKEAWRKKNEM